MCFSPNASLISFFANIISSTILYKFEPVIALFFIYISIMQIFDYIFWKNPEKNAINFYATKLAFVVNVAGPIFLAFLLHFFKKNIQPETKIVLVIYAAFAILYILSGYTAVDYTLVTPESSPSLYWAWNYLPGGRIVWFTYMVLILLIFFQHFPWPLNILVCLVSFFSYVFSYFRLKQHVAGRFWCYYGGFVPIIIVLFLLFFCKHKN